MKCRECHLVLGFKSEKCSPLYKFVFPKGKNVNKIPVQSTCIKSARLHKFVLAINDSTKWGKSLKAHKFPDLFRENIGATIGCAEVQLRLKNIY